MKTALVALLICTAVAAPIIGLFNVHHIHAWEKANGYPFGQMCHSVFTLGVDTCKAGR